MQLSKRGESLQHGICLPIPHPQSRLHVRERRYFLFRRFCSPVTIDVGRTYPFDRFFFLDIVTAILESVAVLLDTSIVFPNMSVVFYISSPPKLHHWVLSPLRPLRSRRPAQDGELILSRHPSIEAWKSNHTIMRRQGQARCATMYPRNIVMPLTNRVPAIRFSLECAP